MNYERKLVIRLFSALIAILFYNFIFYETVKPLTIFGSYFFLSLFDTGISLTKNAIISGTHTFEFIHACIASSAYFLLFILIIATKDIRFVKSIKMMLVH